MTAACTTFALPRRTIASRRGVCASLFYLLAPVIRWLIPHGFPLKRVSAPARSFLVLLAAAAYAIAYCSRRPQLWKETRVTSAHPTS